MAGTPATDLEVRDFAHIRSVTVPLRDLVVLVGPQATGKSLVLQLLKLAKDRNRVARILHDRGITWSTPASYAPLFFGAGFEQGWRVETEVSVEGERLTLENASGARKREGKEAVFYIPAHRTLAIAEGWPRAFLQFPVETPFVARRFSEQLLEFLSRGLRDNGRIFPSEVRLKAAFKNSIDEAVFHGASLSLGTTGPRRQFVLRYGEAVVPYMSWSAGQREFVPLLLGLYYLLPAGKVPNRDGVEWVVIEEPEMGLHPKAIVAVIGAVLDLLHRGYRVAMSTHSPTVVEAIWALDRLRGIDDGPKLLRKVFGFKSDPQVMKTMASALRKSLSVVYLRHRRDGRVESVDISGLSPSALEDAESTWGGLTDFSARVSSAVAKAAEARRRGSR